MGKCVKGQQAGPSPPPPLVPVGLNPREWARLCLVGRHAEHFKPHSSGGRGSGGLASESEERDRQPPKVERCVTVSGRNRAARW